jgi:hypothetical protein
MNPNNKFHIIRVIIKLHSLLIVQAEKSVPEKI